MVNSGQPLQVAVDDAGMRKAYLMLSINPRMDIGQPSPQFTNKWIVEY